MACWFSFSLFLKISAVTFTTACARVQFCFWKASAQRSFRWEVVRHARACSRKCMRLPARAPGRLRRLGCSRRQRRKVDKCRVADKKKTNKPTNKQTNKHTLLFYRYRYIYILSTHSCNFQLQISFTFWTCKLCSAERFLDSWLLSAKGACCFVLLCVWTIDRMTLNLHTFFLFYFSSLVPVLLLGWRREETKRRTRAQGTRGVWASEGVLFRRRGRWRCHEWGGSKRFGLGCIVWCYYGLSRADWLLGSRRRSLNHSY